MVQNSNARNGLSIGLPLERGELRVNRRFSTVERRANEKGREEDQALSRA